MHDFDWKPAKFLLYVEHVDVRSDHVLERRRKSDEKTYIIVKEQHGQFQLALGAQARSYRQLRPATTEAARLASKLNDGRYYVFQAVSVSEVVSPRAITRSLDDGTSHADGLIPASKADPLD